MKCHEFVDQLVDYLECELSLAQRSAVNQHLGACRTCRSYLRSYEATIQLSRAALLTDDAFGTELPDALICQILTTAEIAA